MLISSDGQFTGALKGADTSYREVKENTVDNYHKGAGSETYY